MTDATHAESLLEIVEVVDAERAAHRRVVERLDALTDFVNRMEEIHAKELEHCASIACGWAFELGRAPLKWVCIGCHEPFPSQSMVEHVVACSQHPLGAVIMNLESAKAHALGDRDRFAHENAELRSQVGQLKAMCSAADKRANVFEKERDEARSGVDGPVYDAGRREGHADVAAKLRRIVDPHDKEHFNLDGVIKRIAEEHAALENAWKATKTGARGLVGLDEVVSQFLEEREAAAQKIEALMGVTRTARAMAESVWHHLDRAVSLGET